MNHFHANKNLELKTLSVLFSSEEEGEEGEEMTFLFTLVSLVQRYLECVSLLVSFISCPQFGGLNAICFAFVVVAQTNRQ